MRRNANAGRSVSRPRDVVRQLFDVQLSEGSAGNCVMSFPLGNCSTADVGRLLRRHRESIQAFDGQSEATFLALG